MSSRVKTFGKGGKSVVLNSHMDVVPPADGWETDPYELVIKDGRAYGRGSTDAKGPLACLTHAVKRIIENPQGVNGTIVYHRRHQDEEATAPARAGWWSIPLSREIIASWASRR